MLRSEVVSGIRGRVPALAVLLSAMVLSACGTLSKEECLTADWDAIGERDGAAGYASTSRIAGHAKACAKAGVTPDQTLWRAGYERGLVRYCTPQNGLQVGESGGSYNNVCPVAKASRFLAAFDVGKRAHRARSDLDRAKRDVETKQREVSDTLKSFAGMTDEQRIAAQYDIAELNRQILEHQADILRLSTEVARADQAVIDYRQKLLNNP